MAAGYPSTYYIRPPRVMELAIDCGYLRGHPESREHGPGKIAAERVIRFR